MTEALLNDVDIILISGSVPWISSHLPTCQHIPILCVLDFVPSPPPRNLFNMKWSKFSHSAVGGVTDGWWFFGSTVPFCLPSTLPSTYSRTLRTILCPTVTNVKMSQAPNSPDAKFTSVTYSSKVLHYGGLLPLSCAASVTVCCPSVFTASRWCIRPLTTLELATAFDLPELFSSVFSSSFTGPCIHLPFLRAAPSKLLRAVYLHLVYPAFKPGGNLVASTPKCTSTIGSISISESSSEYPTVEASVVHSMNEDENLILLLNNGSPDAVESHRQKSTKNDDAPVPTILWDRQLWINALITPQVWKRAVEFALFGEKNPLDVLRNSFFLPLWRKSVWRSWLKYFRLQCDRRHYSDENKESDKAGAVECMQYVCKSTWWEWAGGSKLLFWRWPEPVRYLARDGMPTCIKGELPCYRVPQRKEREPLIIEMVASKVGTVFEKGYVGRGQVKSLTSYFPVKKGDTDIRMVYDATKCGLNDTLWVPSFSLPDADTLIDLVEECSWMSDIDIGEMFLNFPLDKSLQPYCGVDFGPYLSEVQSWVRWLRCAMGLKPSPYVAIRFLLFGTEIIRGWKLDPKNALRYDEVRLNLPGMESYNPRLPWVSKIRTDTKHIAADFVCYVDDIRPVGESEQSCNACARRISGMLGYLGIQDASRKRQGASKSSGVWAGSVILATEEGVGVTCTQEKWDKAKGYLSSIREVLDKNEMINHKMLERIRGFLLYVTKTYPSLVPYIKGIHLTLDSWRPGRDTDGWRVTLAELRAKYEHDGDHDLDLGAINTKRAPEFVSPSTRLYDDIATLIQLTASAIPPKRFVRSRLIVTACYGFGDASGSGFGSTITSPDGLRFRHGLWGRDNSKKSSNYRELHNLVEAIEEGVKDGSLHGSELFLFTDNTVAEAAFYKGNTSASKVLFELIVRLRMIEMAGSVKLWVIHVSGKRMIHQGADGLSRGNLLEGVMTGVPMLQYVPLSRSALTQSPDIATWLTTWCPLSPQYLTADDWYFKGHGLTGGAYNSENVWVPTSTDVGLFVWTPPPAAARAAIDQLSISRHKRPSLTHVFICPRLFTSIWRKRLFKLADCVFYVPAGCRSFWPQSMYEPLIIGLLLPFASVYPWQHRRSPEILALEGFLRKVWTKQDGDEQPVLRQFFEL